MNERQRAFCLNYALCLNATRAYRVAYGASSEVSRRNGHRLLTKADIKSYISEMITVKDQETIAQTDEVLQLLTGIARGEVKEEVIVRNRYGGYKRVLKKPSIRTQLRALELLGKRYGLWHEDIQIYSNTDVRVVWGRED